METQIYIVRDDDDINLGAKFGGDWIRAGGPGWIGNSLKVSKVEDGKPLPWVSFSFTGTSVAVLGNSHGYQPFNVQIDDNAPYTHTQRNDMIGRWLQWYQSPTLKAGQHTVNLTDLHGEAVDAFVITPARKTPLQGERLLVDDTYPGIFYQGSGWDTPQNVINGSPTYQFVPYQNSTHQTGTPGDSFTFSFLGTVARVYGLYQGESVNFMYTIDNSSPTVKTFKTEQRGPNKLLLDTGELTAGNHTITLTYQSGKPLILDHIRYTPAFGTLAEMPDLTLLNIPPSSSASPSPVSSGLPTASAYVATATKSTNVAAIAGGVVGSVALLALLIVFFVFRHRRRRRKPALYDQEDPRHVRQYRHAPLPAPVKANPLPFRNEKQGHSRNASNISLLNRHPGPLPTYGRSEKDIHQMQRRVDELVEQNRRLTQGHEHGHQRRPSTSRSVTNVPFSDWDSGANPNLAATEQYTQEDFERLRRRMKELEEENEMLAQMTVPPAYEPSIFTQTQ